MDKRFPHEFGSSSLRNLEGVLPSLVEVAKLAIQLCEYDGTVIAGGGFRTQAQADANAARGTGIKTSRHLRQSDGYGHAIDLIALTPGKGIDWGNMAAFRAMAEAVETAAATLGVPIRQGCDWDMDGAFGEAREYDWAHFEDPLPIYRERAIAKMEAVRARLGLNKAERSVTCPHCGGSLTVEAG